MTSPKQTKGSSWLYDEYADGAGLSFEVEKVLAIAQTSFQGIKIVKAKVLGTTLLLNNWIYRTEDAGTAMPEMIVHVPMNTGPNQKKRVLLIGGGDGFSAFELLKYLEVEHLDMVDIDEQAVKLCTKHFKNAEHAFSDKRVTVHIADGAKYIENYTGEPYDVIFVTGTEAYDTEGKPGISFSLFQESFYTKCLEHLSSEGLFLTDGQNGYYGGQQYKEITHTLEKHFGIVKNYSMTAKYIPGGLYIITIGSRRYDPEKDIRKPPINGLYYYNPEIHMAAFKLPEFLA